MRQKGFTLLEVLIVVLIIGTLACLAVPIFRGAIAKAKLSQVLIDISSVEREVDLLIIEKGWYADLQVELINLNTSRYWPDNDTGFIMVGIVQGVRVHMYYQTRHEFGCKVLCRRNIYADGTKSWDIASDHPWGWGLYLKNILESTGQTVNYIPLQG